MLLSNSASTLRMENVYRSCKIYVEPHGEVGKFFFRQTRLFTLLDSYVHSITLHVTLPPDLHKGQNTAAASAQRAVSASAVFSCQKQEKEVSAGSNVERGKVATAAAPPAGQEKEVKVDNRISVAKLKETLSKRVGIASDFFKLFRLYTNGQEFEITQFRDSLSTFYTGSKIVIRRV